MNIIDKEIEKRENLIELKTAKAEEAKALRAKADALDNESADIDVDVLNAEIVELKEIAIKLNPPVAYVCEQSDASDVNRVDENADNV